MKMNKRVNQRKNKFLLKQELILNLFMINKQLIEWHMLRSQEQQWKRQNFQNKIYKMIRKKQNFIKSINKNCFKIKKNKKQLNIKRILKKIVFILNMMNNIDKI